MKKLILSIMVTTLLGTSCKKNTVKSCWSLVDCIGNILPNQCDKTESEIKAFANSNSSCIIQYRRIE